MEWETWEYGKIESHLSTDESRIASSVLGHVTENGCVMGILLEKVEGDHVSIADLELCEFSIRRLHKMGIRHGDPCRYNSLIDPVKMSVRVVDFENALPLSGLDGAAAEEELRMFPEELREESGAGLLLVDS
jgi:Fe2+ transport system protein FeoA